MHIVVTWAKYVVDAGIVFLFLNKLPQLNALYSQRDPYDEEWLLACRVTIRKFRFYMALGALFLTMAVMFASLFSQIHSGESASMFVLMSLPVELGMGVAVAAFCAFFSHQAVTFWMMNAKVKALACVTLLFMIINCWLLH